MNILVITKSEESESAVPSMISMISKAMLESFSDRGASVIQATPSKSDNVIFNYTENADLILPREVCIPRNLFKSSYRHLLIQNLVKIIDDLKIDLVVAFGIFRCGYAASLACFFSSHPCKAMLVAVWEDAFVKHLKHSDLFAQAIDKASFVCSVNREVTERLSIFHDNCIQTITSQKRLNQIITLYIANIRRENSLCPAENFVMSSGTLNDRCDFVDLVKRVAKITEEEELHWIHFGRISDSITVSFYMTIFNEGLSDRFVIHSSFNESEYWNHVNTARSIVHILGSDEADMKLYIAGKIGTQCHYSHARPVSLSKDVLELEEYLNCVV